MKIIKLFLGELKQTKYLIIAFVTLILLILLAFYTALPSKLIKNSTKEIQIKIGLSLDSHSKELQLLKNAVDDQKIIDSILFLSPNEGKKELSAGNLDVYLETPENMEDIIYRNNEGLIKVYTRNALLGTLIYQLLTEAVDTFNQLQGYSLAYYDFLKQETDESSNIQKMSFQFDLELMSRLLSRGKLTEIHQGINQYILQLFSLLLFLILASIGAFSGLVFNFQKNSGTLKKIRFYQFKWRQLFTAKVLLASLLASPFLVALYFLANQLEQQLNILILVTYVLWLLLVLLLFNLYVSSFFTKNKKGFQLFLILASLILFLMFTGGLIYPVSEQPLILTLLNPAWLIQLAIQDSAKNQISWLSLVPSALVIIFCYIQLTRRWHR